jgi:hypothetical protein
MVEHFALTACKAIHLASAELMRRTFTSPITFACFDANLCRAAASLGFALLQEP